MARLLLPVDGSCVLYLPFWEGAGTFTEDISRYKNHGTITGATWATGAMENALSFDGNDYVDCGHDASLEPAQVTLAAWFKPSVITGVDHFTIATKQNWDGTGYIIYIANDDTIVVSAGDGVNTVFMGIGDAVLNKWQHVVLVVEANGDMYAYYNGSFVASELVTLTGLAQNNTSFTIGKLSWLDLRYFQGVIDEVRVFNRALSPAEVFEEYYRGVRGNY